MVIHIYIYIYIAACQRKLGMPFWVTEQKGVELNTALENKYIAKLVVVMD